MPTPPRRRPAAGPSRRPKVAGLRKPTARPEPDAPESSVDEAPATDVTGPAETAETEAVPTERGRPQGAEDEPAEPAEAEVQGSDEGSDEGESTSPDAGETSGPPPPGYREQAAGDDHDSAAVDKGDEPRSDAADEPRSDAADDEIPSVDSDDQSVVTDGDDQSVVSDGDDQSVVSDGVISAAPGDDGDQAHENGDERPKRPSPSGKRRAGSRVAPGDLRSAERSAGGVTRAKRVVDPAKRALNLAIGMAVAALLFAALGFYFKGQADRLAAGSDTTNVAFTDAAATAEVKTDIVAGLERALSYDYRDLDKTAEAVRDVLAGKAVCEYDAMFGQLRAQVPAQKLVHTTIVRELGVRYLSGDRAEVLAFIDQTSTRVEENQTTASGAQIGVTAERVEGEWKITAFDTFNQPLPNGEPLPEC